MKRRSFLAAAAVMGDVFGFRSLLGGDEPVQNPWSPSELMEPATLAGIVKSPDKRPVILSVAFPFLYRQRHVTSAQFAGPTSKPEGVAMLKHTVSRLSHDADIVVYCGCCPMEHCPNIRPAYRTLKELGFRNVHVLNLATNFHTDWTVKGYPVEPKGPSLSSSSGLLN